MSAVSIVREPEKIIPVYMTNFEERVVI